MVLALFFSILAALVVVAWISHDSIDLEMESKVFSE